MVSLMEGKARELPFGQTVASHTVSEQNEQLLSLSALSSRRHRMHQHRRNQFRGNYYRNLSEFGYLNSDDILPSASTTVFYSQATPARSSYIKKKPRFINRYTHVGGGSSSNSKNHTSRFGVISELFDQFGGAADEQHNEGDAVSSFSPSLINTQRNLLLNSFYCGQPPSCSRHRSDGTHRAAADSCSAATGYSASVATPVVAAAPGLMLRTPCEASSSLSSLQSAAAVAASYSACCCSTPTRSLTDHVLVSQWALFLNTPHHHHNTGRTAPVARLIQQSTRESDDSPSITKTEQYVHKRMLLENSSVAAAESARLNSIFGQLSATVKAVAEDYCVKAAAEQAQRDALIEREKKEAEQRVLAETIRREQERVIKEQERIRKEQEEAAIQSEIRKREEDCLKLQEEQKRKQEEEILRQQQQKQKAEEIAIFKAKQEKQQAAAAAAHLNAALAKVYEYENQQLRNRQQWIDYINGEFKSIKDDLNPEVRKFRLDVRKGVNLAINQIASTSSQIANVSARLVDLLRLNANEPLKLRYATACVLNALLENVEIQLVTNPKSVWCYGRLLSNLCVIPSFEQSAEIAIKAACCFCIPVYEGGVAKAQQQSGEQQQFMSAAIIGQQQRDNEANLPYFKRMSSYLSLWLAFLGYDQHKQRKVWEWWSRFISKPPQRISAFLLVAALETSAFLGLRSFPNQFSKLLNYVISDFMLNVKQLQHSDTEGVLSSAVSQAAIILEEFRRTGTLKVPDGVNMKKEASGINRNT